MQVARPWQTISLHSSYPCYVLLSVSYKVDQHADVSDPELQVLCLPAARSAAILQEGFHAALCHSAPQVGSPTAPRKRNCSGRLQIKAAMKAGEQSNSRVPHSRVHGLASKGQWSARRLCHGALCGCRRSSEPRAKAGKYPKVAVMLLKLRRLGSF